MFRNKKYHHLNKLLLLFVASFSILLISNHHWPKTNDTQFWYIEDIDEQLGKAKFHLLEQVFIAKELRRTLILPNVGKSQIGMRHGYTFDFYYQEKPISDFLSTISVLNFRLELLNFRNKRKIVTAALLYILVEGGCSRHRLKWSDIRSKLWLQLRQAYDVWLYPTPVCFETKYGWNAPDYPQPIIDYMRKNHRRTDIIVSIKYSYFFLMEPAAMPVHLLKHNQTLIRTAEKFANAHRPYVAVHWRMEGARGNGSHCGHVLVNTTRHFLPSHFVYFATDHPFGKELKSTSFKSCCRSDYTDGYKYVLNSLRPLMLNDVPLQSLPRDSGILSIVDKLICEQSDVFLAGNVPCDRHGSFGREMIKFRHVIARRPWLYWSNPNAKYEPHKAYPW